MDPDIRFDDLLASAAGRDEAWYHLRQGDRLFIELARLVDAGRVPVDAATRWMLGAEHLLGDPKLVERARLLIGCAVAAGKPEVQSALVKAVDGIAATQQQVAASDTAYEVTWRRLAISQFRRAPPVNAGRVDFAVYDMGAQHAAGELAQLELSLWPNGSGVAVHHPRDSLVTNEIDSEFFTSMNEAWHAALDLVRREKPAGEDESSDRSAVDGCWRVVDGNGNPLSQVRGRSASGAAIRGWYHLMTRRLLDERVIVLCQVRAVADRSGKRYEGYELASVDGIAQKTRAVAQATLDEGSAARFDTIAVVGAENARQAEETLHAVGKANAFRVHDLATGRAHGQPAGEPSPG